MDDPHKKIDNLLASKNEDKQPVKSSVTNELERVKDNIKFYNKIQNEPVLTDKYDKSPFGHKQITCNHYIKGQAWPESIFNIDKLIRLNLTAKFEWIKRYLSKKRNVPLNVLWVVIIFMIIGIGILCVWIFLPRFM